mmetsp:Transcript_18137/g.50404  ORF Transcript_18137/g.50404 Transcript_18137/m.50404 type:complete len:331 (+) Transcript_18137:426-1418(+)
MHRRTPPRPSQWPVRPSAWPSSPARASSLPQVLASAPESVPLMQTGPSPAAWISLLPGAPPLHEYARPLLPQPSCLNHQLSQKSHQTNHHSLRLLHMCRHWHHLGLPCFSSELDRASRQCLHMHQQPLLSPKPLVCTEDSPRPAWWRSWTSQLRPSLPQSVSSVPRCSDEHAQCCHLLSLRLSRPNFQLCRGPLAILGRPCLALERLAMRQTLLVLPAMGLVAPMMIWLESPHCHTQHPQADLCWAEPSGCSANTELAIPVALLPHRRAMYPDPQLKSGHNRRAGVLHQGPPHRDSRQQLGGPQANRPAATRRAPHAPLAFPCHLAPPPP